MPKCVRWLICLVALCCPCLLHAGTTPPGFQETSFQSGLFNLDGFDWAPNGDLWIIQKHGVIQVLRSGASQRITVKTINVDPNGERGLVGLAVDPAFNTNGFVYFYYTVPGATSHNRVSRFTAVGDTLQNETVLLEGPPLGSVEHNSGNLRFGLDGLLYISMGDNRVPTMAQERNSLLGKILRIATDGSIPPGNPFVGDPNARPEVWAYGFRNPFRFSVDPVTGTLFIGDVGENTWEELDLGIAGANYGHPLVEGPSPPGVAGTTYPIFYYNHNGAGAAIIAGDNMVAGNFPAQYVGNYFYADFARGIIYRLVLDADNRPVSNEEFITGVPFPVHMRVGPDGALYYASINFETIFRTGFVGGSNRQPVAVATATPSNGLAPLGVQFDGTGSSDPDGDPLTYLWDFGDGGTSTAPSPFHTYVAQGVYTATLTVNDTHVNASITTRIVAGNRAPTGAITSPINGSNFNAGDTINFSGNGSDPEDGVLGPGAFTWTVVFHHNTHVHPYLGPISGISSGSFLTEDVGETSTDVYYEIRMAVTDSGAPVGSMATLSDTRSVNIYPNLSTFTLATSPRTDLGLTLDGKPITAPLSVLGAVGLKRTIEALSPQTPGDGHTYNFASWSDGGARLHTIATPPANTTYTASFSCNLITQVQNLALMPGAGGTITLSWTPPADPCLSTGPVVYRVYASSTAVPSPPPGQFPMNPSFALVATTSASTASFTPAAGTQFYLVVGIGSDGNEGPVGAYGH
ncbi:MAG TPA: PQQ-dependent sugar dehydrogenase [Patescibacteria group bacterium]|nr:PQQ-dependent sugar dehydrogenase [Patescibacteria group bacterium]